MTSSRGGGEGGFLRICEKERERNLRHSCRRIFRSLLSSLIVRLKEESIEFGMS